MLTETQKKACAMLHEGKRVQDVATACGVHRTTLWRWTKRRDFRKEYNRLMRNWRRRWKYCQRKEEEKREKKVREAEEKLRIEEGKLHGKPGISYYKALDEYEKALFCGYSLSQALDFLMNGKPLPHKRWRGK